MAAAAAGVKCAAGRSAGHFCGVDIPGCNSPSRTTQMCPRAQTDSKNRIVPPITIIACRPIRCQPLNSPLSRISTDSQLAGPLYAFHNDVHFLTACQFARRPRAATCLPDSDSFTTSTAAGIASRSQRPLPGRDLHSLEHFAFARRTWVATATTIAK